jgi:hypothetical protein
VRETTDTIPEPRDNIPAIAAVGLLAYLSADVAHHALGHAGACLVLGGRVVSLSSIYVNCTIRGATIDLAGPFANLAVGLVAFVVARYAARSSPVTRLFYVLAAAFNLFWFELQLVFSAATRTDDWAWALRHYGTGAPVRYGLIAFGALAYFATIRLTASQLSSFAHPPARVAKIVFVAWLAAGLLACATGLLDPHPIPAILHHAAPQSFALSLGLLFVPRRAGAFASRTTPAPPLPFSIAWIASAAIAAIASIVFLGPGISI